MHKIKILFDRLLNCEKSGNAWLTAWQRPFVSQGAYFRILVDNIWIVLLGWDHMNCHFGRLVDNFLWLKLYKLLKQTTHIGQDLLNGRILGCCHCGWWARMRLGIESITCWTTGIGNKRMNSFVMEGGQANYLSQSPIFTGTCVQRCDHRCLT
jgi:hypothetical protein